jgi:HAD superfamily hydrolase (TIGR01509 family)
MITSLDDRPSLAVFLDLDQTLVITQAIEPLRQRRNLPAVYRALDKTYLPPGTKAFLRDAAALATVGVVTNSPRSYATRLLAYYDLDVRVLVAYHDVRNHKPNPDPILKAAEIVGLPVDRCIHVGDSQTDIEASVRAGSITVAAGWGALNTDGSNHVDCFARNWDEVLEFIRSRAAEQEG